MVLRRLLTIAILAFALGILSARAQTLSNCRTNTPFNANGKPSVVGLELSRDEKTLLAAGGDAKVRYIDLATGNVTKVLSGHTNSLYKAIYSPDEKIIVTSSRDHTADYGTPRTASCCERLAGFDAR